MQRFRRVLQRIGKKSHRVERIGHRLHPGAVDAAEARLDADHAAESRWPDHRAAGLRAQGNRHHAVGHRRGRAARGAARRMRKVVRIARRRRMVEREFRGRGLAEDDAACAAQQSHGRGVGARTMARVDRGVVFGRHVRGVEHVLDAHGHAVQRTARRRFVERAGLCERCVAGDVHPGFELTVARGDALETGRHQGLGVHARALHGLFLLSGILASGTRVRWTHN